MQASLTRRLILIQNPFCATASLAAAFRTAAIDGVAPFSRPKTARRKLPEGMWDSMETLIVVREPVSRFLSGVGWLLALDTASDEIAPLRAAAVAGKDRAGMLGAVENVIGALSEGFGDAVPFLPQSAWLTSKIDTVLALSDLALFFNTRQFGVFLPRLNGHGNHNLRLPTALRDAILSLYSMDVAKFANLTTWTPNPDRPRTVYGPCKSCAEKRATAIAATIDPSPAE